MDREEVVLTQMTIVVKLIHQEKVVLFMIWNNYPNYAIIWPKHNIWFSKINILAQNTTNKTDNNKG